MTSARRLLPVTAVVALVFLSGCGYLWGLGADSPDPGTVTVSNDDDAAHTMRIRVTKVSGSTTTYSATGAEVPSVEEFVWRETRTVDLSPGESTVAYRVEAAGTYVFEFNATDIECVPDEAEVVPNGEDASGWRGDPAGCAGNGTAVMMHSFERDTETPHTGLVGTYMFASIEENGAVGMSWSAGE